MPIGKKGLPLTWAMPDALKVTRVSPRTAAEAKQVSAMKVRMRGFISAASIQNLIEVDTRRTLLAVGSGSSFELSQQIGRPEILICMRGKGKEDASFELKRQSQVRVLLQIF